MRLLLYQNKWTNDESQVKWWEKSRRIGASFCDAADSALKAAKKESEGGMDCFYLSYNKDMTAQYVKDVAFWAKKLNLVCSEFEEIIIKDEDKDINIYQVRFASGHIVQGLPSIPKSLRSKQGKVTIDEAAFVEDLKAILKAAIAMLMWGGQVCVISTHDGDENEFNQKIEDIRAGKLSYALHRTTLDDALEQGLYRAICERAGREYSKEAEDKWKAELIEQYGDDADEELFCIPSMGTGGYFTRPQIKACMKKDIPVITYSQKDEWEELPDEVREEETREWLEENIAPLLEALDPDRKTWIGEDFARDQNLTVIWPGQEKEDANIRVPFGLELFNIPFRQQEQILFYVLDGLPCFQGGAMDARGNGQALAEYAMQRYSPDRIHRIKASDSWYGRWFPAYKATIQDQAMDMPQSADVIEDHRAVKKIKGIPKIAEAQAKDKKSKKKRHGDSAIAGVMLNYAVEEIEGPGEIDFESTGKKRASAQSNGFMEN
ncbi:MAG: terminase family protein [Proteobacteria bacterium]|nr:terminase family protein [Pseudomonadota bacterium]